MQTLAARAKALCCALSEHVGSYLELGVAVAAEYRRALVRQLVLAVVAVIAIVAGLATAWLAGLIALWDTPWRLAYAVITAVLLLLTAAVALWMLLRERPAGPMTVTFRSELQKDKELFQQWKSTL